METAKRLIEVDFPLEQVSLDSVHEKNVRHGHISTLHIWPARRPLAACRAALIATLLPDPGNDEERKAIYRRLAGEVVEVIEKKKVNGKTVEKRKRETRGGILHWGRESGPDLDWFREKIREAYGGRAPKVLDPFAGGGAIPLEAMRLGCEATAIDINPVAWFILKCTLEYPQKLAGQTRPLPDFAVKDGDFMEAFLEAKGFKGAALKRQLAKLAPGLDPGIDGDGALAEPELGIPSPAMRERVARRASGEPGEGKTGAASGHPLTPALSPDGGEGVSFAHDPLLEADLAWQVRAWGRWVLAEARKRLAHRYPTYAEFQALEPGGRPYEKRPLELLEPDENGNTDVAPLNAAFPKAYLDDPRNPRWVAKPTVAYLWARTVRCKGCRATIPLLKTRWLAKKDNKRVLLTMTPNAEHTGVVFGVQTNVPVVGGNSAQRREHDKRRGAGTMTRSGAQCPCCPITMKMEDIRFEGHANPTRLGAMMTAVVVDGPEGKEYRLPTEAELHAAEVSKEELDGLSGSIAFGLPTEPTPLQGSGAARAFSVENYGLDQWAKLFTDRQLLALVTFVAHTRAAQAAVSLSPDWQTPLAAYLSLAFSRFVNYMSTICIWETVAEEIKQTFLRFALPITWDFAEANPLAPSDRYYIGALSNIGRVLDSILSIYSEVESEGLAVKQSAISPFRDSYDLVMTDPPYYDAIPYSDLMDFFYVWLRRTLHGVLPDSEQAFCELLGPKWNSERQDGELIDDPSRFGGDQVASKTAYEDGMFRSFRAAGVSLAVDGKMVVVFANKNPKAWETLAAALIRAGFVVDGSWPIVTEMRGGVRNFGRASLGSSIWLVCKKRSPAMRPGFDTTVLAEMRARIQTQLRAFWDAGIRGPDFVWAATGPALEAYSRYPVVKKADAPDAVMAVSEFLREVRRLVVDFVVGRVLSQDGDGSEEAASLDDVTTYYLLHRNDFRLDDAPIGACILYALSCNLSDGELADRFDILARSGRDLFEEDEDGEEAADADEDEGDTSGKGNKVKLKPWNQRRGRMLGLEAPGGRPVPLIDQAHRLMHLWKAGDQAKVDDYLDARGLKRNALFAHLLQALIELAGREHRGSEEHTILESLSNHIAARGGIMTPRQAELAMTAGS